MTEAWRIKFGILVWDMILIFSLFVGCFYRKGPALTKIEWYYLDITSNKIYHAIVDFRGQNECHRSIPLIHVRGQLTTAEVCVLLYKRRSNIIQRRPRGLAYMKKFGRELRVLTPCLISVKSMEKLEDKFVTLNQPLSFFTRVILIK